jgi:hypothetical protein
MSFNKIPSQKNKKNTNTLARNAGLGQEPGVSSGVFGYQKSSSKKQKMQKRSTLSTPPTHFKT